MNRCVKVRLFVIATLVMILGSLFILFVGDSNEEGWVQSPVLPPAERAFKTVSVTQTAPPAPDPGGRVSSKLRILHNLLQRGLPIEKDEDVVRLLDEYFRSMDDTRSNLDDDALRQASGAVIATLIVNKRHAPLLIAALKHASLKTDGEPLARALGNMMDAVVFEQIVNAHTAATTPELRRTLGQTVAMAANPDAVPSLSQYLAGHPDEELTRYVASGLAHVGTPLAVSGLLKVAASNPGISGALLEVTSPNAASVLQFAAQGNKDAPSDSSRVFAIYALGNMRDEVSIAVLETLALNESNPLVARAAIEVYEKVTGHKVVVE